MAGDSERSYAVIDHDHTEAWESSVTATVSTLNDIGNVTITTATTGDVVRWNGSAWVNYADSAYATSGHNHDAAYDAIGAAAAAQSAAEATAAADTDADIATHAGLADPHPGYLLNAEKYTDAEAIAAVEGEATLVLSGALTTNGIAVSADSTYDIGAEATAYANVFGDTGRFTTLQGLGTINSQVTTLNVGTVKPAENQTLTLQAGTSTNIEVADSDNIVPAVDSVSDLGSSSARWAEVHADKFILPSGTSFPGTPSTGDKFIRTNFRDGDLVWVYNGTYWLTERYFEFHYKHEGAAGTGAVTRYQVLPLDCDVWVMDCDIMRRVNSGAESVTVRVREQDYDGTAADLLSSSVAPGTANVWHRTNHTIDTLLACSAGNTGTTPALLRFEKDSTTNVSLADGTVRYRLRLT